MDILSRKKLTGIIIAVLIVLNVFSIAFIWYNHLSRQDYPPLRNGQVPGEMQHPNVLRFLDQELDLTPAQSEEFLKMRQSHFFAKRELEEHLLEARGNLMRSIFSNKNEEEIITLAEDIGKTQSELDLLTFEHFNELREILNDNQREKLAKVLSETIMQNKNRRNPNPPGEGLRRQRRFRQN